MMNEPELISSPRHRKGLGQGRNSADQNRNRLEECRGRGEAQSGEVSRSALSGSMSGRSLFDVVPLAERLVIRRILQQPVVPAVGNLLINHLGRNNEAFVLIVNTQWVQVNQYFCHLPPYSR